MLCENPVSLRPAGSPAHTPAILVGCGQCIPCRINKRRIWTHRIMLEAGLYSDNAFVTLTYDDPSLPRIDLYQNTLVPKHLQDFLKRFRKSIEPRKIRYYAAGEYGDDTERAHFHLAMFNYPTCLRLGGTYGGDTRRIYAPHPPGKTYCCAVCDMVFRSWGKGSVVLGTLEDASANYIAGYVMKKMTSLDDTRLNGRHPEFARMSNRPGIGADAMHEVASTVLQFDLVDEQGDVPSALRHGRRILPLGRYLHGRLRLLSTGTTEKPANALYEEEMRVLRQSAFDNARSLAQEKKELDTQKVQSTLAQHKIFTKRKKL